MLCSNVANILMDIGQTVTFGFAGRIDTVPFIPVKFCRRLIIIAVPVVVGLILVSMAVGGSYDASSRRREGLLGVLILCFIHARVARADPRFSDVASC